MVITLSKGLRALAPDSDAVGEMNHWLNLEQEEQHQLKTEDDLGCPRNRLLCSNPFKVECQSIEWTDTQLVGSDKTYGHGGAYNPSFSTPVPDEAVLESVSYSLAIAS